MDRLHQNRIWYTGSGVTGIFLLYNLLIVPRHYETLHVNNVLLAFWISLFLFFFLLILLCILYYFIVLLIGVFYDSATAYSWLIVIVFAYILNYLSVRKYNNVKI